MCSTPKPKTRIKGKSTASGSLLSMVSAESRRRFAERANSAQERRDEIAMKLKKSSLTLTTSLGSEKLKTVITHQTKKNCRYWLVSASLKDILLLLFLGKAKHT